MFLFLHKTAGIWIGHFSLLTSMNWAYTIYWMAWDAKLGSSHNVFNKLYVTYVYIIKIINNKI